MSGRVVIGITVVMYDGTDPATAKVVSVSNPLDPALAASLEADLLTQNVRPELLAWQRVTSGARLEGFDQPTSAWTQPAMPEGAIH